VGVDRTADADGDYGDGGIGSDLPTLRAPELVERLRRHEHDDDGPFLHAELEPDGSGHRVEVIDGATADAQCALAIFAADPEPGLHNRGKHEDADRLVCELPCAAHAVEEAVERGID